MKERKRKTQDNPAQNQMRKRDLGAFEPFLSPFGSFEVSAWIGKQDAFTVNGGCETRRRKEQVGHFQSLR